MLRQATILGTIALLGFALSACTKPAPAPGATPDDGPPGPGAPAERAEMSNEACASAGGEVVGDIGDGSIHRPEYRCANGSPPIGTIVPGEGEPIAIEGAVCCGS